MTVINYDFRNKTDKTIEQYTSVPDLAPTIVADFQKFCLSQNNVMQLMIAYVHKLELENRELRDRIREMQ